MEYAHQSQLSIYDIGRINFQIKKILLEAGVLQAIISCEQIKCGNIRNSSSVIITTNDPSSISQIRFMVTGTLTNIIYGMKDEIVSILQSLGYNDPNMFFTVVLNRIDMIYTVLQISEDEFSVILI